MRVNVYSQELTDEVELVKTTADTGVSYYGVRLYLASSDRLHHTPDDDDRSAVTFWLPSATRFDKLDFAKVLAKMIRLVLEADTDEAIRKGK